MLESLPLCDYLANDCTSFSYLQLSPNFAFIIIPDSLPLMWNGLKDCWILMYNICAFNLISFVLELFWWLCGVDSFRAELVLTCMRQSQGTVFVETIPGFTCAFFEPHLCCELLWLGSSEAESVGGNSKSVIWFPSLQKHCDSCDCELVHLCSC